MTQAGSGWQIAPSSPSLTTGVVDVWAFDSEPTIDDLAQCGATLSPDERVRASRFRLDRDRSRFIRIRGALRTLLGGYLGVGPADLVFEYGAHGKPALAGGYRDALKFNVSHSNGLALMAISPDVEVGLDVEGVRPMPDAEDIAARFFSAREAEELQALPAVFRTAAFFSCWTRKEAYLKAVGRGLAGLADLKDGEERQQWSLHQLPPLAGYAAALVTRGHPRRVQFWSTSNNLLTLS
jgi:4'-phosphopantetheinyl transferase